MDEDKVDGLEDNLFTSALDYVQTLTVNTDDKKDTEKKIANYIQTLLDIKEPEDSLFYKVQAYKHKDGNSHIYTIHFRIFAGKKLSGKEENTVSSHLNHLKDEVSSGTKISMTSKIVKKEKGFARNPTVTDYLAEEETPGFDNIPGDTCLEKFLNFWLIIPRVQYDFFDLLYQMYTFDIFHQGFEAKCIHFFTIPINVMLSMMFCAQFNLYGEIRYGNAFAVNGALILLLVLGLAYIIMGIIWRSPLWGIATFVELWVLNMAGNHWYYSYRNIENPWYNPTDLYTNPILWSYIMSFVQASSHFFVPQIPSIITGVKHWESLPMYFCKKRKNRKSDERHLYFLIGSLVAFPFLSVSVAWFSWPHLIGTEIIYILTGIGYRPTFFKMYMRVVEQMERIGTPIMSKFPKDETDWNEIVRPYYPYLKECEIISKSPTKKEISRAVATLCLTSMYLRKGVNIRHRGNADNQSEVKAYNQNKKASFGSVGKQEWKNNKVDPYHYQQLGVLLQAMRGNLTYKTDAKKKKTA